MITRKLGKILRGTATPFQLFIACLLAGMIGFMPGLVQAPGLLVALTLLLVILNANLAVAGMTLLACKLLALILAPLSFQAGRFLIDGPTEGLWRTLINSPVLALFGFDYYLTSGGLVVGAVCGGLLGCILVKIVSGFRRKMASLEAGSERFKQFTSKGWVKFLTYILVGGSKGKKSYEEILTKTVGNPIRTLGVVFAVVTIALLLILQQFAAGPIVHMALQSGLERANGATVDLEECDLNLRDNRLTLKGLAMADPGALDTDLFRADALEADISGMNLLRKRLQLDRVEVSNGSHGEARAKPGQLIGKGPEPSPDPPPSQDPEVKTLDDYIKDAKKWKERLAQARDWLEKLSGPEEEDAAGGAEGERKETLSERLAREVREKGYANVRASHLIEGAPTFTINELVADKVRVAGMPEDTLNITATNLSTHPRLLGREPEVHIRSTSDTKGLDLGLGSLAVSGGSNTINFFYRGLPTDDVAGELELGGDAPLKGGTIDLAASGSWIRSGGIQLNLPLTASLHHATLSLPGGGPTEIDNFTLPIAVTGLIDNPRVRITDKALQDALVKAGVDRAKAALTGEAKKAIDKELGDKAGEEGKKLLDSILGGGKKED